MSKRKKRSLGYDPLAWMDESDDKRDLASKKHQIVRNSTGEGMGNAARKKSDSGLDIEVLESSFSALEPRGEELTRKFYEQLFEKFPDVVPMFSNTTIDEQHKKLWAAISLVINQLRNPQELTKALEGLGRKHKTYGAVPAHYEAVAQTLLGVMEELAGALWTKQVANAWTEALTTVASVMIKASEEDTGMAADNNAALSTEDFSEFQMMKAAVAGAMTSIMMIDRDFNVTYTNKATMDLLTKHQDVLKSIFPGFDVEKLMGANIDMFHKNPAHQRELLSNPANLPYQTDIDVGPLKFSLNVTAILDDVGNYLGNSLEWSDVTEMRIQENSTARLQGAVDSAMTAMVMIDRDFTVTYVNDSTLKILRDNQEELAKVFPGFDPEALLGSNIDMFHKNPAHQRKLLSDPKNLPYQTDIDVGPLKFALHVTAIMNASGDYVGNCLEWTDVTQTRKDQDNTARLQGAVDSAMTAMMMIDREFTVTYANESTLNILRMNKVELVKVFPGFDPEALLGSSIDMFHKNPAHQRKLLSNPNNLPYQTDIDVGPLKFALNVTAIMNTSGDYVGNCLEWTDVTETRKKEIEVARLQSAVHGAQANLMLCDADLLITYINPAVQQMMLNRQSELRSIFPTFDANNLIGQCIDMFHKNPAHQRALLADLTKLPAKAEINVAGVQFTVNATAVLGPDGEWMGNMVEWIDITEQKNAQDQIDQMIQAAVDGQLESRIDVDDYEGFIRKISEGINSLLDAVVDPIRENTRVMNLMADGDLCQDMTGEYKGNFEELQSAVNETNGNLRRIVGQVQTTSLNIVTSAGEIAQGNSDLSQRTEEQASSLEETASSMEELTSTVRQNADNARQANQLASGARDQAEQGGEVVQKAVEAMSEINTSSKKIADIIGVIDEIAFQTNLLALNAAVEAARAGEQGRGFAVVAGEVRNLAQRSAGAAKEIKTLIQDSVEKVEDGSRLVDLSGKTLAEIVGSVKKVSDIIAEIAAASQEQSSGIDQVNKAITQMDEVVQQNAALVEEAAAASESMDEQARGLGDLMSFFKIDENAMSASAAIAPSVAPVATRPATRPAARPGARPVVSRAKPKPAKSSGSDSEWEEF